MTAGSSAGEASSEPSQCAVLRQQGNEAFKRRDYDAAAELYSRALDHADEDAAAQAAILSNRSMVYYKQGRYRQAASDAEASLHLDDANPKAQYRAALSHLILGQPQAAQLFVSALVEPPTMPTSSTTAAAAASSPPPYLCVLRDAAAAMLRHDSLKARLQGGPQGQDQDSQQQGGSQIASNTEEEEELAQRRVQELLQMLSDDLDGEADADIAAVLDELHPLLCGSGAARAAFELRSGYPMVLCSFTEAYCTQAADVLRAASGWQPPQAPQCGATPHPRPAAGGSGAELNAAAAAAGATSSSGGQSKQQEVPGAGGAGAVMWPALVWQRLLSTALGGGGGSTALSAAAMQLLSWAAGDPWARTQVLPNPLPGQEPCGRAGGGSPLGAVVEALQGLPESGQLAPASVTAAVELLGRYGEDALSAEALSQLHLKPLATLLYTFHAAEEIVAAAAPQPPLAGAQGQPTNNNNDKQLAAEQEALQELREKQKAVYDARVVALRRAMLRALHALCGRSELAAAEAPRARPKAKARQPEGFIADLMRLARQLHEQSPKRTSPVLGPDGRPKTFSKKPFAADFKDNPAGDFLAGLDLEAPTPDKPLDLYGAGGPGPSRQSPQPPTLLELALAALLALARTGAAAAGQLFRLDILGLCEGLWAYTTPSVVTLGQHLCAAVAERHPAAFSELLQDGSVVGLAAVLQHAPLSPPDHTAADQTPSQLPDGSRVPASMGAAAQQTGKCGTEARAAAVQLVYRAADKLGMLVDACSGDEFAQLTQQPAGALLCAFELARWPSAAGQGPPGAQGARDSGLKEGQQGRKGMDKGKGQGKGLSPAAAAPPAALAAPSSEGEDAAAKAAAAADAAEAKLRSVCARFVLVCCDKAQRQQGLPREQPPRGGAWDRIGRAALQAMLSPKEPPRPATAGAKGASAAGGKAGEGRAGPGKENEKEEEGKEGKEAEEEPSNGEGLAKLKRGFFAAGGGAKRAQRAAAAAGQPGQQRAAGEPGADAVDEPAPTGGQAKAELGSFGASPNAQQPPRVLIEDITDQEQERSSVQVPAAPAGAEQEQLQALEQLSPEQQAELAKQAQHAWEEEQAQRAWLAYQQQQAEEEDGKGAGDSDMEELQDVYDSTPSLEVREIRNAWIHMELRDKLRWDQTSTDVNVWVVMPRGTRARDVGVSIQPGRLAVELKWYGRVVDGPLHRRVKASEAQWCMEDNEVHVILPKDDRSYWKMLYVDGEEKSYFDLLREAVNADEPSTPYDDMDDRSKDLLDEMLERQAMINEGLIDPDGFDDFRVVVGENSLLNN